LRVIKTSKIRRKPPVAVRPSRIRRDPLPVQQKLEKVEISEEREIWGGVAGILLFAAVLAVGTVGISAATLFRSGAPSAPPPRFGQCYNAGGPDCVLDGDTIYLGGDKVKIAGMVTAKIQSASCDHERIRGIDAALQLATLINKGDVTLGGTVRSPDGELRQTVEVNGQDVSAAMISSGAARSPDGDRNWCSGSEG
jgi:endonuclease YncB( thermonuclease family)